jgi:protein-disulfide isomerase
MERLSDSRWRFAGVIAVAAVLTAALIVASVVGATGREVAQVAHNSAMPAAASRLLAGVRQRGLVLGSAKAPVTLVEYADLQCPYCAAWTRQTLPVLIADYVRSGKLRIVFHGLAFVGPDSRSALTATVAAGRQNRLWDVLDTLYHRQGAENSGWFTEALLGQVVADIPGLDRARLDRDRRSAWTAVQMRAAASAAAAAGVSGTPSFQIGVTGGPRELVSPNSLDPEGIRPAIEQLLAR